MYPNPDSFGLGFRSTTLATTAATTVAATTPTGITFNKRSAQNAVTDVDEEVHSTVQKVQKTRRDFAGLGKVYCTLKRLRS
jgi:hypothetical protein